MGSILRAPASRGSKRKPTGRPGYAPGDLLKLERCRFAERGVNILLEPVNTRNIPGYFSHDFPYATGLINQLGLPNVRLQFDAYHRQILHGDVTMAFRASAADRRPYSGRVRPVAK